MPITDLVQVTMPDGSVQWVDPATLPGLGFFKSKSRKKVESQLPALQQTVSQQSSQITSLTNNVKSLQNSLVQKDQVIQQLNHQLQNSPDPSEPVNMFKHPVVIGSLAFGLIGAAFGIYKTVSS